MKKKLQNVTLLVVDCQNYKGAVDALRKSMEQCEFASVKFLTDIDIKVPGIEIIRIDSIKSKEQYSEFIIKKLDYFFQTEYVLVCQHDGYVIDGNCWNDEFLKYDYIGAPWLYIDGKNVGNGGFSLRSKKLQSVLASDSFIDATDPEDQAIGRLYRDYLIKKHDILFAPEDLADQFSYELRQPANPTFGFHGKFHQPYKPVVVLKRMGAMGDVIRLEPVMRYFNDNGYMVVLNTTANIYNLFIYHDFRVHHISQIDGRLLNNAKFYDLDMSYENNPKVPHLVSYFESCEIKFHNYRNYLVKQRLSVGFPINERTKIFNKYAVLHIDDRQQSSRNVFGVDWSFVVSELKLDGYVVIQLGFQDKEIPGSIYMRTVNENILAYVIASADLFIGVDSGPSHIASGFNIPSVIFFGSVSPDIIHVDLSNIAPITNHSEQDPICEKPYCWHSVVGCAGVPCYIDNDNPPCAKFSAEQVLNSIKLVK